MPLGVVIYELLTGSCPFQRETTMGTIAAILRDGPAPLSPEIPSVLRSIVEKCLEKESSRRYSSAPKSAAAARVSRAACGVATWASPTTTLLRISLVMTVDSFLGRSPPKPLPPGSGA
jgi:eukaryotic-like serine/threonine-protein kinase